MTPGVGFVFTRISSVDGNNPIGFNKLFAKVDMDVKPPLQFFVSTKGLGQFSLQRMNSNSLILLVKFDSSATVEFMA